MLTYIRRQRQFASQPLCLRNSSQVISLSDTDAVKQLKVYLHDTLSEKRVMEMGLISQVITQSSQARSSVILLLLVSALINLKSNPIKTSSCRTRSKRWIYLELTWNQK